MPRQFFTNRNSACETHFAESLGAPKDGSERAKRLKLFATDGHGWNTDKTIPENVSNSEKSVIQRCPSVAIF